jgi:hypothetical protein
MLRRSVHAAARHPHPGPFQSVILPQQARLLSGAPIAEQTPMPNIPPGLDASER